MEDWNVALQHYFTSMRAAGRRPGTIRLHRHYLYGLANTYRRPWIVTTEDLRQELGRVHWSPETRKSARSTYRSFYAWGYASGLVESDPAVALVAVRVPPGTPRPAPETVVARAVRDADERIAFMAMLGAYAGLRCGEIATVHERDLVGDTLRVDGKGGKVRTVPVVHPVLLAQLQRVRGWAFPGRTGGHLSPGHVSKLLSSALPQGWTGHTLRHRMATTAYAGTRDLLAVGAVLGHSKPETTQRYVLLPDDALRAAMRAAAA